MKFCTKCGRQLNDDDLFCPACGAKQVVAEQQPEQQEEHRFNFEEARQEKEQKAQPAQETKVEKAKPVDKSFSLKNSLILFIGYIVLFIVYLILNKTLFNQDAMLGKIGFFLGTLLFTMMQIINLVKSKNRHNQFLVLLHLAFVIVMASCIVGVFITLINT